MRLVSQEVALALLGAGLSAVPGLQTIAAGTPAPTPDASLVQQMRGEAEGPVAVSADRATGEVGFIRARHDGGDLLPGVTGDSSGAAVSKASTYLDEYGAAFGARDGQLSQTGVSPTATAGSSGSGRPTRASPSSAPSSRRTSTARAT